MGCIQCDGYWQCSRENLPCGGAADPIDTQIHCFVIETKQAGAQSMMRVQCREARAESEEETDAGWDPAGELCFRFMLFLNSEGKCFVRVEPV